MKLIWFVTGLLSLTGIDGYRKRTPIWKDGSFKIPDFRDICQNFKKPKDVNATCVQHLNVVCHNMTLFRTMYSASAKYPFTGMGYASRSDFGNYDQCLTINHPYNGTRLLGEYCKLNMFVPRDFRDLSNSSEFYRMSVCKPHGCSDDDYNNIIVLSMNSKFPFVFQDGRCETVKDYEINFTVIDIVTMSIFGTCIFLMFVSTAYDIYICKKQLKTAHPLLISFSVLANGKKLIHTSSTRSTSKEQIQVFHGFRVISMIWIVSGHATMLWEKVPVSNIKGAQHWPFLLSSWYILSAPLAVDTFFYMSGFLMAFRYLKHKEKPIKKQVLSVPCLYIHRYLRLTPPLLMIYLVVISVFKYLGNGPDWYINESYSKICKKYWWSFFLYIQNYKNYDSVCMPQSWFLSTDFQLYLLAPLALIPVSAALKKPAGLAKCMNQLLIFNIFCTFLPLAVNLCYKDYINTYGTHSKLIDYFSGMMLAIFMRERIEKPFLFTVKDQRRSVVNFVVWVVVLLGMLSMAICYQDQELKNEYVSLSVFYALMRPAWCIGLSWITYSCYHGYGGFVNWILSRPAFQVLGKLTYCIYLVHQSVIDYHFLSRHSPWYFNEYNAFYFVCGDYVVSVILAIFWTLAFESPFIILQKFLLKSKNKSVKAEITVPQTESIENIEKTQPQDLIQNRINDNVSNKYANTDEVFKISNNDVF